MDDKVKGYLELANYGDKEAQCNLGNCYYSGESIEQSYEEAIKWYTRAAEQGYARAQCNLGVCYYNGKGVQKNYEEAIKWYTRAAEQGYTKAQYNLGVCYEYGEGVEKSIAEAIKWYKKAAEQGHIDAKEKLIKLFSIIKREDSVNKKLKELGIYFIEKKDVDNHEVSANVNNDGESQLFIDALYMCVKEQKVSISRIQRKFSVGYVIAVNIIEQMEDKGYISPNKNGSNQRDVLLSLEQFYQIYGKRDETSENEESTNPQNEVRYTENHKVYEGTEPFVFISYAHKDKSKVLPMIYKLMNCGYRVWFDEGIDPGTEWDENIARHVEGCEFFIACITKNYLASSNCKDELNYARDLDKGRLIIYFEEVELPSGMKMRLNRLQSIFKYTYKNESEFYNKLYQSQGIEKCKK